MVDLSMASGFIQKNPDIAVLLPLWRPMTQLHGSFLPMVRRDGPIGSRSTRSLEMVLSDDLPSGKRTKMMGNHHVLWVNQVFRLGHVQ
jgi:hypothetical protein